MERSGVESKRYLGQVSAGIVCAGLRDIAANIVMDTGQQPANQKNLTKMWSRITIPTTIVSILNS